VIFLGYPDGGLGSMSRENFHDGAPYFSKWTDGSEIPYDNALSPNANYAGENVVRDLYRLVKDFAPTRVVTTDENDTHADHVAAFQFTKLALQQWRDASPGATSSTRCATQTRFFTTLIHHHIWPVPHGVHLDAPLSPPEILAHLKWTHFAVDDETIRTKQRALSCYKSQLVWTPFYLRSFLRRTELFREIEIDEPEASAMG
jgi:LmbE family N-acetylglucosaminyl deacetylase